MAGADTGPDGAGAGGEADGGPFAALIDLGDESFDGHDATLIVVLPHFGEAGGEDAGDGGHGKGLNDGVTENGGALGTHGLIPGHVDALAGRERGYGAALHLNAIVTFLEEDAVFGFVQGDDTMHTNPAGGTARVGEGHDTGEGLERPVKGGGVRRAQDGDVLQASDMERGAPKPFFLEHRKDDTPDADGGVKELPDAEIGTAAGANGETMAIGNDGVEVLSFGVVFALREGFRVHKYASDFAEAEVEGAVVEQYGIERDSRGHGTTAKRKHRLGFQVRRKTVVIGLASHFDKIASYGKPRLAVEGEFGVNSVGAVLENEIVEAGTGLGDDPADGDRAGGGMLRRAGPNTRDRHERGFAGIGRPESDGACQRECTDPNHMVILSDETALIVVRTELWLERLGAAVN